MVGAGTEALSRGANVITGGTGLEKTDVGEKNVTVFRGTSANQRADLSIPSAQRNKADFNTTLAVDDRIISEGASAEQARFEKGATGLLDAGYSDKPDLLLIGGLVFHRFLSSICLPAEILVG